MNPTKLLDTTLLGRKFYADEKTANWIKIDSVVLGNSKKYGHKSGVEKNIGKLLDLLYDDKEVDVCLYKWSTGEYFTKTGFNISDSADYSLNRDFTAFVAVRTFGGNPSTTPGDVDTIPGPIITPVPNGKKYITWNKKQFVETNGKKFIPLGPNSYWLGEPKYTSDQQEVVFIVTKKMKGNTVRSHTLGFAYGPANILIKKPELWKNIDNSFALAKKHGIKLIIPLLDTFAYGSGNYGDYCDQVGVKKEEFFTNIPARKLFKEFIKYYLNHVNPLTGEAIKDCTDIIMIELGNELGEYRPENTSIAVPTEEWLTDISNYIRSIDANHLIMCPTNETLGKSNEFNIKNFDVISGHYYWFDMNRLNSSLSETRKVKKPYVCGEFNSKFDQKWYDLMYEKKFDGAIFWVLFPHKNGVKGGGKIEHNDGYAIHYPEDMKYMLLLTNYFRKVQGLPSVTSF